MKNKFLNYLSLTLLTAGAAYGLYQNKQSENKRTLRLENIEALAVGEEGGGNSTFCYGSGSLTCPRNGNKVKGYIHY